MQHKKIAFSDFHHLLEKRDRNANKSQFGHLLVIGGDEGMAGAPWLAALGGARVGAGLVSIATHAVHVNSVHYQPEIMCYGIRLAKEINPLLAKATVVVIGPGLGQSSWSKKLFKEVLKTQLPIIIDADGLNLLASKAEVRRHWILTPHPGEAARLLNLSVDDIQQDRNQAVKELQKRYGGIVVLKGAGTLIKDEANMPLLCQQGNPGMASAGMGDLLAGIIGGLIAQGLPLLEAAAFGVCLHAKAGDIAAEVGERGMLATDLLPSVRKLVNL